MTERIDKARLLRDGFLVGYADLRRDDLPSFFSNLGTPVGGFRHPELVRDIRPQAVSEATPNTLSSRYGLGTFPFHTDGAHWTRPPRYLVLYCVSPGMGNRPTNLAFPLATISAQDRRRLRRDIWRVIGGRHSFWARVLDGVCGDEYLRFDSACMTPTRGPSSTEMIEDRVRSAGPLAIFWEPSKFLVIDNWRILHARGAAVQFDGDRHHWRLLIQ